MQEKKSIQELLLTFEKRSNYPLFHLLFKPLQDFLLVNLDSNNVVCRKIYLIMGIHLFFYKYWMYTTDLFLKKALRQQAFQKFLSIYKAVHLVLLFLMFLFI